MSIIGNLIWLLTGGIISALAWAIIGLIWCISIVGIPIGAQCFKFAELAASPFGKEVEYGGGSIKFLLKLIWIITCGIPLSLVYVGMGIFFCITIIGIPFGKQYFKFAKLALMPLGARIIG